MDSAGTRALSVSEIIDQRPLSRFQIFTIGLCGLVFWTPAEREMRKSEI